MPRSTSRRNRGEADGRARGVAAPRRAGRRPAPASARSAGSKRAGIAAASDSGGECRQRFEREHVAVARRPERLREPAQFHAQRFDARRRRIPWRASARHARSRRMPMRIWCTHSGSVCVSTPPALPSICCRHARMIAANAFAPRCARREHGASSARTGAGTTRMAERVAALGLAGGSSASGNVGRERVREFEEPSRIAGLELEFDFVDRRAQRACRPRRRALRPCRCTAAPSCCRRTRAGWSCA